MLRDLVTDQVMVSAYLDNLNARSVNGRRIDRQTLV